MLGPSAADFVKVLKLMFGNPETNTSKTFSTGRELAMFLFCNSIWWGGTLKTINVA